MGVVYEAKNAGDRPASALAVSTLLRETAAFRAFSRELGEAVSKQCDALTLERDRASRTGRDTAVDHTGRLTVELDRRPLAR